MTTGLSIRIKPTSEGLIFYGKSDDTETELFVSECIMEDMREEKGPSIESSESFDEFITGIRGKRGQGKTLIGGSEPGLEYIFRFLDFSGIESLFKPDVYIIPGKDIEISRISEFKRIIPWDVVDDAMKTVESMRLTETVEWNITWN